MAARTMSAGRVGMAGAGSWAGGGEREEFSIADGGTPNRAGSVERAMGFDPCFSGGDPPGAPGAKRRIDGVKSRTGYYLPMSLPLRRSREDVLPRRRRGRELRQLGGIRNYDLVNGCAHRRNAACENERARDPARRGCSGGSRISPRTRRRSGRFSVIRDVAGDGRGCGARTWRCCCPGTWAGRWRR